MRKEGGKAGNAQIQANKIGLDHSTVIGSRISEYSFVQKDLSNVV